MPEVDLVVVVGVATASMVAVLAATGARFELRRRAGWGIVRRRDGATDRARILPSVGTYVGGLVPRPDRSDAEGAEWVRGDLRDAWADLRLALPSGWRVFGPIRQVTDQVPGEGVAAGKSSPASLLWAPAAPGSVSGTARSWYVAAAGHDGAGESVLVECLAGSRVAALHELARRIRSGALGPPIDGGGRGSSGV